jgi:hypothetical protein
MVMLSSVWTGTLPLYAISGREVFCIFEAKLLRDSRFLHGACAKIVLFVMVSYEYAIFESPCLSRSSHMGSLLYQVLLLT